MKYSILTLPEENEKKVKLIARIVQPYVSGISYTELIRVIQHEEYCVAKGLSPNQCDHLKQKLNELATRYRVEREKEEKPSQPVQPEVKKVVPQEIASFTPIETIAEAFPRSSSVEIPHNRIVIPIVSILTTLVTIAAIMLILSKAQQKRELKLDGVAFSSTGKAKAPSSEPIPSNESPADQKSREFLDSADQKCMSNGTDTEQLYRFALSYNRNNKNAWFGLLNCFRATDREEEAQKIEKEMIAQFGNEIIQPKLFPLEFGDVETMTVTGSSASIVLLTSKENMALYSDLFQLSRRYSALGTYSSIRILVKRPDGTGLFMTLSPIGCMSYDEFSKSARFEEI